MAWAKLDDGIFDNPKIVNLSKDAKLLYLVGLVYCAKYLTDGRLTPANVRIVQAVADVNGASVEELRSAHLWKPQGGDFLVNDWTEYNPPASKVREAREAAKERMRKLRSQERSPERSSEVRRPRTRTRKPVSQDPYPQEGGAASVGRTLLADAVFKEELCSRFPVLDWDWETAKWLDYVKENPPKNYRNSLRNWLAREDKWRQEESPQTKEATDDPEAIAAAKRELKERYKQTIADFEARTNG